MQGIRLDQYAAQIQFAEQLPEHRPLVVLAGGIAGLTDRHTKGCRIERDLGDERGSPAGGGLDGTSERLAVAYQLIKIACTSWDLGDRPVADRRAEGGRRSSSPSASVNTLW
jgi:hypothetical protein